MVRNPGSRFLICVDSRMLETLEKGRHARSNRAATAPTALSLAVVLLLIPLASSLSSFQRLFTYNEE